MLRPENASYQATCNAAGQTFGFALGWTGVTALMQLGYATFSSFMLATGVFFVCATLAIAALKTEQPARAHEEPEGVADAYTAIWRMLALPPVRTLLLVLFTWKLGFAVVDSVAPMQFQEMGMAREQLTYLSSLLMPLEILLPLLAARYTAGPRPFGLALACYPWKVLTVPLTAALVYRTPDGTQPFAYGFWGAMLGVALVGSVTTEWMFVSQIALFARVSDPSIAGTYITFLNTMANLGNKLPPTATFFLVDWLGTFEDTDGFLLMTAACTIVGVLWYLVAAGPVRRMQQVELSAWRVGVGGRKAEKRRKAE